MLVSELDRELAATLAPLVSANATVRVPPFANTLCLAVHYLIGHHGKRLPRDRVALADWNKPGDLAKHLHEVFVFYANGNIARAFRRDRSRLGFYDSLAISRFRPRLAFLRKNDAAVQLAARHSGRLTSDLMAEALSRGKGLGVLTDINEEAKTLIDSVVPARLRHRVYFEGRTWPGQDVLDFGRPVLFVYGAPCTSYLSQNSRLVVPLKIGDELLGTDRAYDTHVIWHVPDRPGAAELNLAIRESMERYHQLLFAKARDSSADRSFEVASVACNRVLGNRHPSFPLRTFASARSFRRCLADHHGLPGARRHQIGA